MSSIGLNTGLKALLTSQASLETIGHNVSNANTPGYSRQRLEVSASRALLQRGRLIGSGVSGGMVSRSTDALLLVRTTGQLASLSSLESSIGGMTEVEALLGEPGGFGIGSGLSNFFGAVSDLSTSTEDLVMRTGVLQQASALTTQFNTLASTMQAIRVDTANQVGVDVRQVNALAEQLVQLNREIGQTEATGLPANDLRDAREQKLRELASYVDINFHEDDGGVTLVTTGGRMLVGRSNAYEMTSEASSDGSVKVFIEGSPVPIDLRQGKVAGHLKVAEEFIPGLTGEFDELARNLIFEVNRLHSTGTPAGGTFQSLTSSYAVRDSDLDGLVTDELLAFSGLPFEVQDGELYVNVTRLETGELETHKIAIDASTSTVGQFVDALKDIDGINANLNSFGALQVFADAGHGFDFAPRLNPTPDDAGTLGGGRATLGSDFRGPYALSDGDTLQLTSGVGTFTVALDAADFVEISQATAEELAEVLNADPGLLAGGLRAVVTDDRLYFQTAGTGAAAALTATGGTALGALGFTAGTTVNGSSTSVDIQIGGAYTGDTNSAFIFTPRSDGVIGTTPGLEVDVFGEDGTLVATLNVGAGYQPGTELEVAQGVTVRFGVGELSASNNDAARLEVIADSDTSDVLASFGLNGFFTGTSAEDISVRDELELNPDLIAAGASNAAGDNRTLLRMLDLQTMGVEGLGNESLGDYYGDVISGVGFDISTAGSTRDVEEFLLQNLETRREQTSGVNVDEELVDMVRFEQAFGAASRYIQVLNELSQEVLNLI